MMFWINNIWMREIAKAIYIGMIHDTGIFQYSNTSPKTLHTAADLISYGFDFPTLIDKTFYEKTYVQNQILEELYWRVFCSWMANV